MQELFDLPDQYDAMLRKGIAATGNDKMFFVHGRLNHVLANLRDRDSIKTILDYGCGTGETSLELARLFPGSQITGSDLSTEAIRFASHHFQRPNLRFIPLADLHTTSFDLIYLNGVVHHVPVEERARVASGLYNWSKPGTRLWIFENNPANPGTQWAMYANPFDKGVVKVWPSTLRSLLKTAGFEILQTDFLFYFPQWLAWFRPLEKHLVKLPLGGQFGILAQKP